MLLYWRSVTRQNILVFLYVMLAGFSLSPAVTFGAQTVVGDQPTTYHVPNRAAINILNKQLSSGAITYPQYKADSNALVHNVTTVSNMNASNTGSKTSDVIDLVPPTGLLNAHRRVTRNHVSFSQTGITVNASTGTQGLCAEGYAMSPPDPYGDSVCQQDIRDSSGTIILTNLYWINKQGVHQTCAVAGFANDILIWPGFRFGLWWQFTPTGNYVNFFLASQAQADTIVQQLKTAGLPVTFMGQNSQGLHQVQVFTNHSIPGGDGCG